VIAKSYPSTQQRRWLVHLGLILTVITSLMFEFVLTIHIVLGLVFSAFVVIHLVQRRRTTSRLAKRLLRLGRRSLSQSKQAVADLCLSLLSIAMLISGFWDWSIGHPTRIRWHALTGVALAVLLLCHTVRRWKRLRTSSVR
jgi:protein-S-isoprenylcysteine O-methyltransferase Ste14